MLRTSPPAYDLSSLRDYFKLKTENQLSAVSYQRSAVSVGVSSQSQSQSQSSEFRVLSSKLPSAWFLVFLPEESVEVFHIVFHLFQRV